ncbi:MAG: class I SAM-dependent methyltransferase [Candidatus Schekmanbacteria bacterium]|nr:class I SAM-dependent methyltransferase [Candidatus Schekmanbacteria bacterium]
MANQEYWDNLWQDSPLLEAVTENELNEYLCPEITRCIKNYCLSQKVRFLEAGCGLGVYNFFVEKNPAIGFSLGADKSNCLWAVQEFRRNKNFRSKFVQADVTHLPLKDNSFDFITSLGVVEHFEKPVELLLELKRLLAPGGILFIDTPNESLWSAFNRCFPIEENEDYYTPQQLAQFLKDAEFEILEAYSRGFSNAVMTPLYTIYDFNPHSVASRCYHFLLQGLKRLITPLDKRLDKKYGFYSIVIARKAD